MAPLLVEAPFFTLATRTVDNVYPRGDGRFLLAWTGGSSSERNRLEFRDYSMAQGLSARQSMPYEVFGASSNQQVLQKITGTSGSPAGAPPPSSTGRYTYQPPQQQPGVVERLFKWLFG